MGSYFQSAILESHEEGVITILLASDFAVRQVNDPKNAEVISGVSAAIFGNGAKVLFRSVHAASEKSGAPAPVPGKLKEHIAGIEREERQKILAKPEVSKALNIFGGEVVGIEKITSQETDK